MLRRTFLAPALTALLFLVFSLNAEAALLAVSGKPTTPGGPLTAILVDGNPVDVQLNLANGFPIWYQDVDEGLKLEMCLEQGTGFCLTEEPFARFPISFPFNFGAEAFYWTADAAATFTSTPNPETGAARGGNVLVVNALEAGFILGFPSEGDQAVFSRIRIRARLPVAGTYVVRHPFGQAEYIVTPEAVLLGRQINQTQDIGNILAPPDGLPVRDNFVLALPDGPAPAEQPDFGVPAPVEPPRVDDILPHRSIGPFLTWDTFVPPPAASDPELQDLKGNLYLGKPEQPGLLPGAFIPREHLIAGSPVANTNFFEITLTNPPDNFFLLDQGPAGVRSNTIRLDNFVVMGKIFNDGDNIAPTANPDFAGGAAGSPVLIDVVANDVDVRLVGADPFNADDPDNKNVHGINPQAISLDPAGGYLTRVTTAKGGTVTRDTPFNTGLTSIRYQPADGFTGIDTFEYVVQDTGGLVSEPAQVTVTVDDLQASPVSVRPKLMKWDIRGTSSLAALQATDAAGNTVVFTPLSGAQVPPAGAGPIATPGTGSFTATIVPSTVTLGTFDIDFTLEARNLPSAVTLAHIHTGAVGVEGGVLVDLFLGPTGTFPANGVLTGTATGVTQEIVNQILDGQTYVNVHTVDFGAGEIRGQLGRNVVIAHGGADLAAPVVGVAAVRDDLSWSLPAKLNLTPGLVDTISVQSSAGGQALALPVKVK